MIIFGDLKAHHLHQMEQGLLFIFIQWRNLISITDKIMKKILFALAVSVLFSCTNNMENKKKSSLELLRKDTLLQHVIYSNIDTINGHWRLSISKEQAKEKGVPEDIYDLFSKDIDKMNTYIDSIKRANPEAIIGYNFPDMLKE